MIIGREFIETVQLYFSYLTQEFAFQQVNEKIKENFFYEIRYRNEKLEISISYENIEDYLQVIIFKLINGELPNYDDKTHTLHLNKLNKLILPQLSREEIEINNTFFSNLSHNGDIEKELLKCAKELRLCLNNLDIVWIR